MSSISDEEFFSADSLDNSEASKKKKVKKLKPLKKQPKTYLELYQNRLVSEFLKYDANQSDDGECKKEATTSSNEKVKTKSSKIPRYLWTNFVERRNQTSSSDMLKKRLEYGSKMSLLNRTNQQCLKLHREHKLSASESSLQDNKTSKTSKIPKIVSSSLSSRSKASKEITANDEMELLLKLESMKIQHQRDQRMVEKMRISLITHGDDDNNETLNE